MMVHRPGQQRLLIQVIFLLALVACSSEETDSANGLLLVFPGEYGEDFSEVIRDPALMPEPDVARLYRQHNMRQLSSAYRGLELILRYGVSFDTHMEAQALTLLLAARRLPDTFVMSDSAAPHQTGARPDIWEDPARFSLHARGLQREAETFHTRLAQQTVDRDTLLQSLDAVRHHCLACHQAFRWR